MNRRVALGATLAAAVLAGAALAADGLKSGPQEGDRLPLFGPKNLNGESAGENACLIWQNGDSPVVAIFAKEMNDGLTGLVKKVEAESAKHSDCEMGSFVVFCNDDDGLEKQLKDFIAKEKLKKTVVAIDKPAGPRGYKISPDADVTVVLYVHKTVKANYAFKKGELTDKAVAQIVGDLPKILPESK